MAKLYIPEDILQTTERFLRRRGQRGREGLALWAGFRKEDGDSAVVFCATAGGRWAHGVRLSFAQLTALTRALAAHRLQLLAQLHNHPDRIPHSLGDEQNPASHERGYLSIVVPDMGLAGIDLADCFIYEYEAELQWRELTPSEKTESFCIVPTTMTL